jgi:hypothetical protein
MRVNAICVRIRSVLFLWMKFEGSLDEGCSNRFGESD